MKKQTRKITSMALVICMALMMVLAAIPAFAEGEPAAEPQTRVFDEAFDRMLDAVSGSTEASAAFRSVSWAAGECNDDNDPIFKIAGPKISAGFDTLSLEVRSPDGSVKLEDLVLAIRISDAVPLKVYALNHDDIVGGLSLSEGEDIGSGWVTISIDFAQTEVGIESSNPDAMVGFHLYSAGEAGKLDIRQVAVEKGGTETIVKRFDGGDYDEWWSDSEGGKFVDIPQTYHITDKRQIASEVATSNNTDGKYAALALGIFGSGNVTVAPVLADGTVGAAKAWADLKDLAGATLPAIDGTERTVIISLESLGAKDIRGIEIAVTDGSVNVSRAFFTNLDEPISADGFPTIDASTIDYLSQFDYEYLTADGDYNKAVEACAGLGMNYILSYSAKNNVITNGHLVLDAQGEAFTSIKLRSTVTSAGRQYLVIKYALEGREDLTDFRFDVIDTATDSGYAVKYPHEWLADTGLLSTDPSNPYSGNGYKYLVIDIAKTWGVNDIAGVDMYIGGEGRILIDEIFYADAAEPDLVYGDEALAEDFHGKELIAEAEGYAHVGWVNASVGANHRYMVVDVEGDISKLRFEFKGVGTYWAVKNAEGTLKNYKGQELLALSGKQTIIIDLVETGADITKLGDLHIHNDFAAAGDVLKITSVKFADKYVAEPEWGDEALAEGFSKTADAEGYSYIGGVDVPAYTGNRYMLLDVEGDISQLRLEMGGGTFWVSENTAGTLKDFNGNNLSVLSGKQTIVIDLIASGVDVNKLVNIHFHNTFVAVGDELKITSIKFAPALPAPKLPWGGEALAEGLSKTADAEGYSYIGGVDVPAYTGNRYMLLDVEGDISELRLEMGGGVFWASENAEGTLKDFNGNNLSVLSGKQTIVIDLIASGVDVNKLVNIHFHNTFAAVGDEVKITSIKFAVKYDLTHNDDSKPTIDWTLPESAEIGDEITVSATASDNYSASDAIEISYEVLLDGTAIELTEGKFTAAVGTYTVKVIAIDEAGNEAVDVKTLTVREPEPPACTEHIDADKNGKCDNCDADVPVDPPVDNPPVDNPPEDNPPVDDKPTEELGFFEQILNAILNFFKMIGDFFAGLFANK